MEFLAIDFETADYEPDSACAVGLVRVKNGEIVSKCTRLIRPPRETMLFTHIHGLTLEDVADAPTFGELWPEIKSFFEGVDFLAAHNASFDQGVLRACCKRYGIPMPPPKFQCTVKISRALWGLRPANLPAVCKHFNIPLNHHDAGSDTIACARIMIEALRAMKELEEVAGAGAIAPIAHGAPAVPGNQPGQRKRLVLRRLNGK